MRTEENEQNENRTKGSGATQPTWEKKIRHSIATNEKNARPGIEEQPKMNRTWTFYITQNKRRKSLTLLDPTRRQISRDDAGEADDGMNLGPGEITAG